MALTPEKIAEFDRIMGTPPTTATSPGKTRADQIRALAGEARRNMPFMDRAKDAFKQGITDYKDIVSGKGEAVPEEGGESALVNTRRGVQATASAFSTPIKFALKEAYNKLPEVTQKGLTDLGQKVGKKIQQAGSVLAEIPGYQDWVVNNPESANDLENILKTYASAGEISGDILAYNQAAQAGKYAVNEAGKVIGNTGRAMKEVSRRIGEHAITPNTQEAEEILRYRANTPFLQRVKNAFTGEGSSPQTRGSTAIEKGIYGTEGQVGVKAKRIADDIWNKEIKPALDNSQAVMSKDQLFDTAIKRISNTVEPAKRQAYMDAYEALQDEYRNMNYIPAKDVQNIKSSLDKFTPDKVWRGQPIANEYTTLRADMANDARNFIYDTVGDNIKPKYLDWSNLHDLQEVGVKAISNAGLKGGSGKLITSLWDTATTPVKTIGGQVLYKVGNALEFVGDKGIKTLGDYLSKQGLVLPQPGPGGGNNLNNVGNGSGNSPQNNPSYNNELNHSIQSSTGGVESQGSVESMLEKGTGWQPGMKAQFDSALHTGNAEAVKSMLPQVPPEYAQRFSNEINKLVPSSSALESTAAQMVSPALQKAVPTQANTPEEKHKNVSFVKDALTSLKGQLGSAGNKILDTFKNLSAKQVMAAPFTTTIVSDESNTNKDTGLPMVEATPGEPEWTATIPGAKWIWRTGVIDFAGPETVPVEKKFNVTTIPSFITVLTVAGDEDYDVFLNDELVGKAPQSPLKAYEEANKRYFNIKPLLKEGENTFLFVARNKATTSGHGNFTIEPYKNPAGLIYRVDIFDDDKTPVCPVGTRWNGTQCVPNTCPPGTHFDAGSGRCVNDSTPPPPTPPPPDDQIKCPYGYQRVGNKCVPIKMHFKEF